MTSILIVSLETTAFAAGDDPRGNQNDKVQITKELEMAKGLDLPDAEFTFIANAITQDAPSIKNVSVSYSKDIAGAKTERDEKEIFTQTAEMSLPAFPHAGAFEYEVKEENNGSDGVTYSTLKYNLQVYVINSTNGLEVESVTVKNQSGVKVDDILFTNTYIQNTGKLVIEKNTKGKLADKTKKFEFTITLTPPPTSTVTEFTATEDGKPCTVKADVPYTFHLADQEQLVFTNMPVGTTYLVTETGVEGDGYTPTVSVREDGVDTVKEKTGTEKDSLESAEQGKKNLVGDGENKVLFVNNHTSSPNTGLLLQKTPFFLLIGVMLLSLGIMTALKRRQR